RAQQGEGSGTPIEPHHTPSPEAQSPSHTTYTSPTLSPVTTTSIPTVTPSDTPIVRKYIRRTRIAQSSVPPTVADEPASPLRDVSQGEACPTDSGFIADRDRATINKSSSMPHDSAPRVTSPAAVEGSMQQTIPKLTALCTSLQRQLLELTPKFQAQEVEINRLKERVKLLEDRERMASTRFRDDAPIKGRSMDEGEAATEWISDESEEMATVLTSMDAATVLASGVVDVPTSSGSIPTTSTPAEEQVPTGIDVVPTASLLFSTATVVTPYSRRKGKEVMVESKTPKKQKVQEQIDAQVSRELEELLEREDQRRSEQIARDAEIARIHAEKELQIMIDGLDRNNETVAKYLSNLGWKVKDFRGMTSEEVEAKFNSVWKQLEDFIPMGSKEEAERIKRKGLSLEQENAKKQKISEEVTEENAKKQKISEEITRLGGSSASYQFFIDLLKHLDREDLNQLWRLVKETLSNRPPTSDKEMELWVELSRLYEPDHEDQQWTHTQNLKHALVEWKLYDSCRVHHVTSKDKEIFMLVEKDYPLRKGLALMMISYKLQVENYSQMVNDLILKIYNIANSPRQQGLYLTYTPSTISTQKPTEHELDLLFKAMYDGYIGGQSSAATRTVPATLATQVLHTLTASTTIADTRFIDADHPCHVYKLKKALYGTKEAPRAWYVKLSKFLQQNHFNKGTIDPTLFIGRFDDEILVIQVYVDDIIFGTLNMGLWYTNDSGFELIAFSNADYAGCRDTLTSTSGGTQFLGEKLVGWSSKKQDCMALSITEAEYVSLSVFYAQVLWMQTQLTDYGFHFNKIPIYCNLKSAIAILCNPVEHSRTKHIVVRYHFIKEHVEKGMIDLYFVKTDYQLADLFTKSLQVDRFNYLVCRLGMRSLCPQELERLAKS
nr:retrovirus-related Pol polyprotein from transposon TNT 1-94 [Tanacetum cinerariifolium]